MPEPAPRSALADHLRPGRHGVADGPAGVELSERRPAALVQLAGAPAPGALHEALHGWRLAGVPQAGRCARGDGLRLLWNGPGQYLAVVEARTDAVDGLCTALAGSGAAVVDLGHARTVLRLEGPAVVDLLAKGCPLDLEAMGPDDCAASVIGHFNALVHRDAGDAFELYVTRSFAVAFLEWVLRAGEEFGIQVR